MCIFIKCQHYLVHQVILNLWGAKMPFDGEYMEALALYDLIMVVFNEYSKTH